MIEFILIYLLVGIVFSTAMNWNEIVTIFNNWGVNEICKAEAQEFFILIITCMLGWGIFVIYWLIIDPIKNFFKKNA